MRLKIGKKLRTASLDSKFTGSFEKRTVAKIEIFFLKLFVSILGLCLQRYSTSTKRYPRTMFLKTLNLFSKPELLKKKRD